MSRVEAEDSLKGQRVEMKMKRLFRYQIFLSIMSNEL